MCVFSLNRDLINRNSMLLQPCHNLCTTCDKVVTTWNNNNYNNIHMYMVNVVYLVKSTCCMPGMKMAPLYILMYWMQHCQTLSRPYSLTNNFISHSVSDE